MTRTIHLMNMHHFFKKISFFLLISMASVSAKSLECAEKIFPPFATYQQDQINYLPHYGCVTDLQLAGHLPTTKEPCHDLYCSTHQASLFYWFAASQESSKDTPIILWLNGGPGASSFYGFFSENGPYFIDKKGKLQERTFSWNKKTHFLMIDNPKGVGLSYAAKNNLSNSDTQVAEDLYNALAAFYQRYPELKSNPLYLSGESYAGKYVAELAAQINRHHSQMNLKGLLVGDGWVNPLVQQSSVAQYAYSHGLVDKNTYHTVQKRYALCANAIKQGKSELKHANKLCMKVNGTVAKASGVDRHDIRTLAEIDYQPIIEYLNKPEVREAIHVDPRVGRFTLFSEEVSQNMESEIQQSAAPIYEQLLNKKIPILIYNGLEDGTDSNFIGADLWLEQLNWHGAKEFNQAPTCKWHNKGTQDVAGYVRQAHELTQIKVRGAGHMAPMDQPENILDMINKWIHKQKWCQEQER